MRKKCSIIFRQPTFSFLNFLHEMIKPEPLVRLMALIIKMNRSQSDEGKYFGVSIDFNDQFEREALL